jgi:hypothetical protein
MGNSNNKQHKPIINEIPYKLSDIANLLAKESHDFNVRRSVYYDEQFEKECQCVINVINQHIRRAVNNLKHETHVHYTIEYIIKNNLYYHRDTVLKYLVKFNDFITNTYSEFTPTIANEFKYTDIPSGLYIVLKWPVRVSQL